MPSRKKAIHFLFVVIVCKVEEIVSVEQRYFLAARYLTKLVLATALIQENNFDIRNLFSAPVTGSYPRPHHFPCCSKEPLPYRFVCSKAGPLPLRCKPRAK
jgi:hypothetical protein